VEQAAILSGLIIASAVFCLCLSLPIIYKPIRSLLQPWAMSHVARGHHHLLVIQRASHPVLDTFHNLVSWTCCLEFYITVLPFLFWSGHQHLARLLTVLMALCIYAGNALKDTICSDRPDWTRGVKLVGQHQGSFIEYGLPSTHTVNTICMLVYVTHFYNFHGPGGGKWLHQTFMADVRMEVLLSVVTVWTLIVMHGRLYLGMHSPIDVVCGIVVAFLLLAFFIPLEDFIDAWITSGHSVYIYQPCLAITQLFCYPRPLRYTPSYKYAVAFTGTVLGEF